MKIYSDISLINVSQSNNADQNVYVLVGSSVDNTLRKASLTVNGAPMSENGNIPVSLTSTLTGLSSSLSGSPFFLPATYSPRPPISGTLFVVTGETGPASASNGQTFIFVTSSTQAGQWQRIYGFDQVALDARYARIDVAGEQNLTSSYATTASTALYVETAQTASFVTSSDVYGPHGSDSILSASYAVTSSYAHSSAIQYVTNSIQSLTGIEVADFSESASVTFTNGVLKFIFGSPTAPTTPSLILNDFATDRFNKVLDSYTITGTFNQNGYTLISASLYTGSTLIQSIGTGTSNVFSPFNTSGSQVYRLEVTSSSPLDGAISNLSTTTDGTLNKLPPTSPTITIPSSLIQLGIGSNQIEQGATGSINVTMATGSARNWTILGFNGTGSFSSTNVPLFGNINGAQETTTFFVTASATGSSNITFKATANYDSGTNNDPVSTAAPNITSTLTKIRSVRYGVAPSTIIWTQSTLEDLSLWTSSLGPTPYITGGFIAKGTTNPNNYQFTMDTTVGGGGNYLYIVIDNAYTLTQINNVNNSNSNDINLFTPTTIGNYKVYRTNNLSSTTILYQLKT